MLKFLHHEAANRSVIQIDGLSVKAKRLEDDA